MTNHLRILFIQVELFNEFHDTMVDETMLDVAESIYHEASRIHSAACSAENLIRKSIEEEQQRKEDLVDDELENPRELVKSQRDQFKYE